MQKIKTIIKYLAESIADNDHLGDKERTREVYQKAEEPAEMEDYQQAIAELKSASKLYPDTKDLNKRITELEEIKKQKDKEKAEAKKRRKEELQRAGLVFVQGGSFQMGSNDGASDEKPVHTVTVSDFYIGKYAVTLKEYDKYCQATGRKKPKDVDSGRGRVTLYSFTLLHFV